MLDDEILKVINSLHQILGGLRGSSRSRPSIKGSEALGQDLYLVAVGMRNSQALTALSSLRRVTVIKSLS
ncbi:hypothetical protein FRC03_003611 [Tulasnella sp. 419]|nr:hypothetical protein FRC03_003611 [Tulasnella sp. 419]